MRATRVDHSFDPDEHADALRPLIDALVAAPPADAKALDRAVRQHPRRDGRLFRKSEIIAGFRAFGGADGFGTDEAAFVAALRLRPA